MINIDSQIFKATNHFFLQKSNGSVMEQDRVIYNQSLNKAHFLYTIVELIKRLNLCSVKI